MYPDFLYQNYSGKYVATEHFNDFNVIASGKNIESVLKKTITKGIKNPVIFYVPERNIVNIYHVDF
jgi:Family of unknown function (DUF5678)